MILLLGRHDHHHRGLAMYIHNFSRADFSSSPYQKTTKKKLRRHVARRDEEGRERRRGEERTESARACSGVPPLQQSAQARQLPMERITESSSGLELELHPLVLLNVSDHW